MISLVESGDFIYDYLLAVSGGAMKDLLITPLFHDVKGHLKSHVDEIRKSTMVHLHAPADVSGLLGLAMLEASFLDTGIQYRRRFLPAQHHIPRDERIEPELPKDGLLIFIDPFEDTWKVDELPSHDYLHITPLSVSVRIGSNQKERRGALDVVAQCAALSAALSPNGSKTRLLRPFASTGLWLREALDTTFDPVHTTLRDILRDEGTFRMVPLPEVASPAQGMIPGLSERMLKRLQKGWGTMDAESRASAISELVLPALQSPALSTPRLEELVWHRLVVGESDVDVMSQVFLVENSWPKDEKEAKIHASKLADNLLKSGVLH